MHHSPLFIDFEASSLNLVDSYPIQVGFVDKDNAVQKYFINPESVQGWTDWNIKAEKAHRFSREHIIQHGLHPLEVTKILNKELLHCDVYCNGYVNDLFWCDRLYKAANKTSTFEIKDFFSLVPPCFMESPSEELIPLYSFLVKITRKTINGRAHDAGNDAYYLAKLYDIVKNAEDLLEQGVLAFEIEKKFFIWLMTSINALSDDCPASFLTTAEGKEQIKIMLNKIHYGELYV